MQKSNMYFNSIFNKDDQEIYRLSDAVLRTEDGYQFNIHKYALSNRCEYFYNIYKDNSSEEEDIMIPGIKGEILDMILYYIYTDKIDLTTHCSLVDLVIASKRLHIDEMFHKMVEYATNNVTVKTCLSILLAASYINNRSIRHESYRFALTHFEIIAKNEMSEIVELPLEILKQFLGHRSLGVSSELTVWDCILKWLEFDRDRGEMYLPELLACLKVADISEDIAFNIIEHDVVSSSRFGVAIKELKSSGEFKSYLDIFRRFYQSSQSLGLELSCVRLPSSVSIIQYRRESDKNNLYVTYDEHIDLWRTMFDGSTYNIDFHQFQYNNALTIGQCIYVLAYGMHRTFVLRCFNFITNREIRVRSPKRRGNSCVVVKHRGLIFALIESQASYRNPFVPGCDVNFNEFYKHVIMYDPVLNEWKDIPPMSSVSDIYVASLGTKLYVLGMKRINDSTARNLTQTYDLDLNEWMCIPSQSEYRNSCALISYCNRLFMIGGRTGILGNRLITSEAYDPSLNRWVALANLPYHFNYIRGVIIENQLMVIERFACSFNPRKGPAMWNNERQVWTPIASSSPLSKLRSCSVETIDDEETLHVIAMQNRKNVDAFVKSPFISKED